MLGDLWDSSVSAAEKLGIKEKELSSLREFGFLKPGIHWKSAPSGQLKPWSPKALYNVRLCKKIIFKDNFFGDFNKYVA